MTEWEKKYLEVDDETLYDLTRVGVISHFFINVIVNIFYIAYQLKTLPLFVLKYFQGANYLDVKGLLDLCCAAIANKIAGKNPRQIRELFGLPWPTVEKKNKQRKSTSTSSSSA